MKIDIYPSDATIQSNSRVFSQQPSSLGELMLSSTTEYLEALRQGDFLRAVEWVEFVRQRYPGIVQNSDALLPLCTFELLNKGFTPDDIVHFEVLYALLFEEERVFQHLDFDATTLFNAGLQAWVWINAHVASQYYHRSEIPLDARACLELMQEKPEGWGDAQNNHAIEQTLLVIKARGHGRGIEVASKIRRVLEVRETLQTYEKHLRDHLAHTPDFAADSRLQALQRTLAAVMEDARVETVNARVEALAAELRRLSPRECERVWLDTLSPLPEINIGATVERARLQVVGFFERLPTLITTQLNASSSSSAAPSGSS
ncbi:hypothetical protein E4T54_08320 [Legionella geestiana]|nr:hypothetical protein E4T54_08320 [Legionella geestiana]